MASWAASNMMLDSHRADHLPSDILDDGDMYESRPCTGNLQWPQTKEHMN